MALHVHLSESTIAWLSMGAVIGVFLFGLVVNWFYAWRYDF